MTETPIDTDDQLGFDLGEQAPQGAYAPDLAQIREDLHAMLDAARGAISASPWDARTLKYNKIVFPLLTRWIPDDEAAQLCFEFAREVERIEALLAA